MNRGEGVFAGPYDGGLYIAVADQLANAHGLNFIILDQQQVLHWPGYEILQMIHGFLQGIFGLGFSHVAKRALREGGFRIFIDGNDVNRQSGKSGRTRGKSRG